MIPTCILWLLIAEDVPQHHDLYSYMWSIIDFDDLCCHVFKVIWSSSISIGGGLMICVVMFSRLSDIWNELKCLYMKIIIKEARLSPFSRIRYHPYRPMSWNMLKMIFLLIQIKTPTKCLSSFTPSACTIFIQNYVHCSSLH